MRRLLSTKKIRDVLGIIVLLVILANCYNCYQSYTWGDRDGVIYKFHQVLHDQSPPGYDTTASDEQVSLEKGSDGGIPVAHWTVNGTVHMKVPTGADLSAPFRYQADYQRGVGWKVVDFKSGNQIAGQ